MCLMSLLAFCCAWDYRGNTINPKDTHFFLIAGTVRWHVWNRLYLGR